MGDGKGDRCIHDGCGVNGGISYGAIAVALFQPACDGPQRTRLPRALQIMDPNLLISTGTIARTCRPGLEILQLEMRP